MPEENEDDLPECWKCFGECELFDDDCPICHGSGFAPPRVGPLPPPEVRNWLAEWASEMVEPAIHLNLRNPPPPNGLPWFPPPPLFSGDFSSGSLSVNRKCTLNGDELQLEFTIPVTGEEGFFPRKVTKLVDCSMRLPFKQKAGR
jgi:hypothetical protein